MQERGWTIQTHKCKRKFLVYISFICVYTRMNIKVIAWLNAVFLLGVLLVNYLANSLPIGWITTGELSNLYPNLFVPAWITFAIWWLIYLLLIGFVVRQLVDVWKKDSLQITKKIWPWFIVSCCANIGWILVWHYQRVERSLVLMLLLLGTLIIISKKVKTGRKRGSRKNKFFTQIPFWVYVGRISVATIANTAALLVHIWRERWGQTEVFWTIAVIIIATLLWVMQLRRYTNIPFVLVLIWAFWGIMLKRMMVDLNASVPILWILIRCTSILSLGVGLSRKRWIKN